MAKRRKDPYYHRGEPGRWGKIFKVLAVILVIALVFGGTYALTYLQPRKVGLEELGLPSGNVPPEISAEHDKSEDLERNFREATKIREVNAADIENLREALRLENDYLIKARAGQRTSDRIVDLTETLESYESKPLTDQCIALQTQAENLEKANDIDGALKLYSQAAALEDQIIRDYPHSKYRVSATKLYETLRHKERYLQAMPIHDKSLAAENAAEAARARKEWKTAFDKYTEARDLQVKLNHEFSDSSFTSSARVQSLEAQITALNALPQREKIDQLLADAHQADAAKNYDKAAELYQEAERQQRDLVAHYPKSIFATDANFLESIKVLGQTALSRRLANEIVSQAAAVFGDLRQRKTDGMAPRIDVLQQKAELFHKNFPESKLIDDELQLRLDYLHSKSASLAAIQEQVYGQLLAVPGQTRFLLGKQEVSQALYQAVADGNPSRNSGAMLPVDSVNWNEAHEFCRRLSWILERPVRLPTMEEYNDALSSSDSIDLAAATWNADNAEGKTHPVATKAANAKGFYDLLGNVAEWLERPAGYDDDVAPAAGGNVQTPQDAIRNAAPASLALSTRNPYTGFRFVVDSDDTAPLMPASTINPDQSPAPASTHSIDTATSRSN